MPAIFWIISGLSSAVTGFLGFFLGNGVSGFGSIIKWGVIGFVAYFIAKQMRWM